MLIPLKSDHRVVERDSHLLCARDATVPARDILGLDLESTRRGVITRVLSKDIITGPTESVPPVVEGDVIQFTVNGACSRANVVST